MNNSQKHPFREEEIDWQELAGIGILRDELEMSGQLEVLLRGEKTEPLTLELVLLGVDMVMDATLQFVKKGEEPILEIIGIHPDSQPI